MKKGDKKTKFYILHKEDLDEAVKNTVLSFVKEDEYNNYLMVLRKIVMKRVEVLLIFILRVI